MYIPPSVLLIGDLKIVGPATIYGPIARLPALPLVVAFVKRWLDAPIVVEVASPIERHERDEGSRNHMIACSVCPGCELPTAAVKVRAAQPPVSLHYATELGASPLIGEAAFPLYSTAQRHK